MAAMISRVWSAFSPPQVPKQSLVVDNPLKSHPEVMVQAVAARDRSKAEAVAKSHGISEVKNLHQDILDDPNIDCVFIPLPNGLHYEWAIRAIRAGKHVLLEKPSTSNATEAKILFNMPELFQPDAPVILEAFHTRFYPSWNLFKSLIDPADVVHVTSTSMIPWWASSKDDIHFNYFISGATMIKCKTLQVHQNGSLAIDATSRNYDVNTECNSEENGQHPAIVAEGVATGQQRSDRTNLDVCIDPMSMDWIDYVDDIFTNPEQWHFDPQDLGIENGSLGDNTLDSSYAVSPDLVSEMPEPNIQ
ncbi:unnamed protein product [Aureobasidium vineae]|uniref:D-xylose 1-dehydrogenase (NADP(+), D-xylono-1,5-lactone-forming) n=1 Tax=Aureobasidium vineae TaxID=2773715 RepID=A0A9N8JTA2_9PEZI|nr:unnamed protein product [Aureobasidium vineae]